jgi:fluoroquinolone resistance protein
MAEADHRAIAEALRQHNRVTDADLSQLTFDEGPHASAGFENCAALDARFAGGELPSSAWNRCRFVNSQFSNMNLAGARFGNCRFFDGERGRGCVFRFCDLRGATFENCDLTLSTFFGCELCDVRFGECRMSGITVEKPSFAYSPGKPVRPKRPLRRAGTFDKCNMTNAIIRNADLSSLRIIDCDLSNAELEGTVFRNSSLRGTNLTNASLRLADLSGADLRGADLSGFDLHDPQNVSGMQVSAGQQHHLLRSLGIDIHPDED